MIFKRICGNGNEKTKLKMKKPIYLGFLILEVSKTLMYKFLCDYIKPKYGEKK